MPRLLSRALLVLGGATAATAAAWLLSSGTAAADPMPQVPSGVAHVVSTSDSAATPFETPLSTAVSSVADPVTDAGSTAVDAVTQPSQHALPLPAADSTGLDSLTTGLRATVGQLGDRLPVSKDLPAQLVQHLGRTPVSTPAVPVVAVPLTPATPRHLPMQPVPFASQHSHLADNAGDVSPAQHGEHGTPLAPGNTAPAVPLTVPAMPGGSGAGGFASPAGLGLTSGTAGYLFPELHVIDVLAPAAVPAAVMPGKQPGVTPD
ncbi:MAG TPA: hypothetical protein VGJ45_03800 [Pseudonocardiaceae bacterium]|jgi:hypothetical protein